MIRGWGLILEKQEELGSQKVVKLKLVAIENWALVVEQEGGREVRIRRA